MRAELGTLRCLKERDRRREAVKAETPVKRSSAIAREGVSSLEDTLV